MDDQRPGRPRGLLVRGAAVGAARRAVRPRDADPARNAMMPLYLLDRDGVVIVNRSTKVKAPDDLELLPGVAQ